MTIHKEGYTIILITLVILGALNLVVHYFTPDNKMVQTIGYVVSAILFLLVLQFFRSPSRPLEPNESLIISPADGKVVVIEEVEEPEYFKGKRMQISIFMSPLNAHVNWYPISGEIKYMKYHPGEYLVAWHPKSSTLNERTTIVLQNDAGKEILVRQIAGAVARRIVYYGKENQKVIQGEQLGFIKFGSRLDVYLPLDAEVLVELEQMVKGSATALARF
ncbi:MAG: phosphatidylserine decarboxylase family protein [Flavobacteriales bacterium]|nr:phosphatidylserine decarboxylase family protein [Flavobacteriales bacterium]